MRWPLELVGLLAAGLAMADEGKGEEKAPAMAVPSAATWGASWEPAALPKEAAVAGIPWFQKLIDDAAPGAVLRPAPGRYSGPVVLKKALTIEGDGKVVIDGGGTGTVFTLEASHATLRGLVFTGSGSAHDSDDACLNVRGNDNVVDGNDFQDCLFGVDLKQSNRNLVARNHIRSKNVPLGMRGDAIRLWYSMENRIEENVVTDSRDVVAWYSNDNHIKGNTGRRGRYSLHFMYAQHNVVEDNRYYDNSVGIYVMYTDGIEIRNNLISHSTGATGMGIGFTEASDAVLEGNSIVYCAVGIASDKSPFQPESSITIRNNRIAYNGVGLAFIGEKEGTRVEGNVFEGNIDQVAQNSGANELHTVWLGNYWDDYQGFDRNGDGVGDTPYELYSYADRLWMEQPHARFFKNAPLMEALDFLERLAPFSTPDLLVRDARPSFTKPEKGVK